MEAGSNEIGAPLCVRHPQTQAAGTCARCGRFACVQCLTASGRCVQCEDRESAGAPSALAIVAGILGGVSLCLFPLAIVAIALAVTERRRIRTGKSSPAGVGWAQAGAILGAVGLFLGAIFGLLLLS